MTANSKASIVLIEDFLQRFPAKAMEYFEGLSEEVQRKILDNLPPKTAAQLLRRLSPDVRAPVFASLESAAALTQYLDPSLVARMLPKLSEADQNRILEKLPSSLEKEVQALTAYPSQSAGALMETSIMLLHPEDTVGLAMEKMKGAQARKLGSIFLVDVDGVLKGRVYLQELISRDSSELLGSISHETPSVNEMAVRDDIIELVEKFRVPSIPVINSQNIVLGAIYHESLFNIAQQEALNDLQTMVGVSREEKALSPPFFAVRKRLPWLSVNLLTTFLAAFVVGMFEDTIAKITALAVLLPVVAGQSGNTGAQSQAVTMRGLALREIRMRHKGKVLFKEGVVGLTNGFAIGVLCAGSVYFWSSSAALAGVIGVAMVLAMFAAGLAGAIIPMFLTAIGQDPATSSSIILTTVTDIVGFVSFLGLAAIFGQYLH